MQPISKDSGQHELAVTKFVSQHPKGRTCQLRMQWQCLNHSFEPFVSGVGQLMLRRCLSLCSMSKQRSDSGFRCLPSCSFGSPILRNEGRLSRLCGFVRCNSVRGFVRGSDRDISQERETTSHTRVGKLALCRAKLENSYN